MEEVFLRKKAIEMYLQGISKAQISLDLQRSRQWVHKWISRYKTGDKDWMNSQSNAPINTQVRKSKTEIDLIVRIRKEFQDNPYSQKGASSIMYRMNELGHIPPSKSTINRIIKQNGLLGGCTSKIIKKKDYPDYFLDVQVMDLIGPRHIKGSGRFYFFTIIDKETHYAGAYVIRDKTAESITKCIVSFWQSFGLPDFLQMDNELSFKGSNKYPRSLGLLLRVVLSEGVRPIFIPPAEPWRNGIIEKFNDTIQKKFFNSQQFSSVEDVENKLTDFIIFHNNNHRYSSQQDRTPTQTLSSCLSKFKLNPSYDLTLKPVLETGILIFIRFIRSDLKISILNSVFEVKKELSYTYVVAKIIVEKHVLLIIQDHVTVHAFEFAMPIS